MLYIDLKNKGDIVCKHKEYLKDRLQGKVLDTSIFNNILSYTDLDYTDLIRHAYNYSIGNKKNKDEVIKCLEILNTNGQFRVIDNDIKLIDNSANYLIMSIRNLLIDELNLMTNDEENIFTSSPEYHENFINVLKDKYLVFSTVIDLGNILGYNKLGGMITKLLGYDDFVRSKINSNEVTDISSYKLINPDGWGAYHYAFMTGIEVCPYCNASNITPIYSDEGKTRGPLDHFYCKIKFPLLSISIWNLIPSCTRCNSNFKGSNRFSIKEYLHPYHNGLNKKLVFKINNSSINPFCIEEEDINISLVDNLSVVELKSLNKFQIEKLYQRKQKNILDICRFNQKISESTFEFYIKNGYAKDSLDVIKYSLSINCNHETLYNGEYEKLRYDAFQTIIEPYIDI